MAVLPLEQSTQKPRREHSYKANSQWTRGIRKAFLCMQCWKRNHVEIAHTEYTPQKTEKNHQTEKNQEHDQNTKLSQSGSRILFCLDPTSFEPAHMLRKSLNHISMDGTITCI